MNSSYFPMRWDHGRKKRLFEPTREINPDQVRDFIESTAEGANTLLDVRLTSEYEENPDE